MLRRLPIVMAGFLGAGLFHACSCESRPPRDANALCVEATSLALTASENRVLILPEAPAQITLEVLADQAAADDLFFIDAQGDGDFELQVSAGPTLLEFSTSGQYPIQATAVRCDSGELLVARVDVFAQAVTRPSVAVAIDPDAAAPILENTLIEARATINADPGGVPVAMIVDWGDGTTEFVVHETPTREWLSFHAYADSGVYQFAVRVKDSYGLEGSWTTPLVSTIVTVDYFSLDLGERFADYDLLSPDLPTQPTHAVVAAGDSGVVLLDVTAAVPTVASRLTLNWPAGAAADAVAVDGPRGLAYVAAGERGIYLVDVSAPTEPTTLFPHRVQLPASFVEVDRLWLCNDRRRVYFRNRGDGVYAFDLTGEALLATLRDNPASTALAWAFVRAVPGNLASKLLRLPHPDAHSLHCLDEETLLVADDERIVVYDLAPFFGVTQEATVLSSFVPAPALDYGPLEIRAVAVAQRPATASNALTVEVALGSNGTATYNLTRGDDSATWAFRRHRRTIYSPIFDIDLSGGSFAEEHVNVSVDRGRSLVVLDGVRDVDVHYLFNNNNTSGAATQTINYSVDACHPQSAGFSGVVVCQRALGAGRTVVEDLTEGYWFRSPRMLQQTTLIQAPRQITLPVGPTALALGASEYWIVANRLLYRYDRLKVEAAAAGPAQPGPDATLDFGFDTIALEPADAGGEALLVGYDRLAWIDGSGSILATVAHGFGAASAGFDRDGRKAALIDTAQRKLHVYRRSGGSIQKLSTSVDGGYGQAAGCLGALVSWRAENGQRTIYVQRSSQSDWQQRVSLPMQSFTRVACNDDHIYVSGGDIGQPLSVKIFALGSGAPIGEIVLPFVTDVGIDDIVFRGAGSWLGVQVKGRGMLVFDVATPAAPRLVAADYFGNIVNASHFGLVDLGAGNLRYGGLAPRDGSKPPVVRIKGASEN